MKLEHREPSSAALRAAQRDIDEAQRRAEQEERERAQRRADLRMSACMIVGIAIYYLVLWLA